MLFVVVVAVSEYGQRLHEDLQPDLHDAADWALVGMSPVSGAHAPRIPAQLLGGHQRTPGNSISINSINSINSIALKRLP